MFFKSKKYKKKLLQIATCAGIAFTGLFGTQEAHSTSVPFGVNITASASATYSNSRLGAVEAIRSNTVLAAVPSALVLNLEGGREVVLSRASTSQYNFNAENTGSIALVGSFRIVELGGDDFNTNGRLFLDNNNNGIVDGSDSEIDETRLFRVEPRERVFLIYEFETPSNVDLGDFADTELRASFNATASSLLSLEVLRTPFLSSLRARAIIDDTSLFMLKSATLREDDNEIDYAIITRNNAETAIAPYNMVEGEPLSVDGIVRSGVLIRDAIPLNTTLASVNESGGLDVLYHLRGNPRHSYTQTLPSDLSSIDAVAFLLNDSFDVGRSANLGFTVKAPASADRVDIVNTAVGYLTNGTEEQSSNEVITTINGPGQTIEFRSESGGPSVTGIPFGRNLIAVIDAAACNVTSAVDEISVQIITPTSGDREVLIARETGPNTGTFQTAAIGVIRTLRASQRNNVLEAQSGDNAVASASDACISGTLTTSAGLAPGGFVFNSVDNTPVAGATVDISLAGAVSAPVAQAVTDAQGYFDLGTLPAGDYRIGIIPPVDYSFPSIRPAFPGFDRRIDAAASFGVGFRLDASAPFTFDIPLDPASNLPLTLDKTADRATVRRGGFVIYTLNASNRTDQALANAQIIDRLPTGFSFVEGSARLDGAPMTVLPGLRENGVLSFDLGFLGPNSSQEITYGVRVGTATREGSKVNTAVLSGQQIGTGIPLSSQQARATVSIDDRGGVFADEAVIVGRVFLDKNLDGIQTEKDEPGIPGIKIVTSTGLSVVTDEHGRYSLFGLRPITGVLALQKSTLPKSTRPVPLDVDDAGVPGSRFIDLKRGELRTEDFPLFWSEAAAKDVEVRLERFRGLANSESLLRDDLPLTFDAVTRSSSRNETGIDTSTELFTEADKTVRPDNDGDLEIIRTPIEELVKNVDPALGFVGIADGHETSRPNVTLRIKGPVKGKLSLRVNGEPVPDTQIGAKVVDRKKGVQVFEYVALRLKPEANIITAVVTDPFGNERGQESLTVYAPGDPVGLVIVAPDKAPADSRARIPVAVRIVDAAGRLVRVPAEVTLTAQRGIWDVRDIRDNIHGVQAYIDNGEATFDFIPPDLVGTETIGIVSGFAEVDAQIAFSPDLEERVFVGVVEGAIRFGEDGSVLEGLIREDEISSFEETTEGVRGQLYLKGKILGDNLLTLRYDSDQDTRERLFRDIRRDEFYPVYGDNSERGFDAQSNSELFVKVERGQSFILYGDIAVEPRADAIRLGAYRRSLTGGQVHLEHGPVTVDLFVAETDERQRVLEQRGRGVSGPYDFNLDGLVDGTEIVEILVRDRDQPDLIISRQLQTRFTDYSLDFFSGALIFNRPISQNTPELNPVSIRVTYETTEGAGDDYLVYGGEVRLEPIEGIAVGYREVRSDAERGLDERRTVRSAYAEAEYNGWGKIQVEGSQTVNQFGETGNAGRIAYEFKGSEHTVRAEAARTDEDFDAPNSYLGPGREEIRITTDHTVIEGLNVNTDTLYTRDVETRDRRIGSEITARYAVDPSLDLIAGGRAVETRGGSGDRNTVYSGIAGAGWRPSILPGASFKAEFEQDFTETENWRVTVGGDYQWSPTVRFYAQNEISSADTGFFGIGDGADTNFTTRAGAEYHISDNISGFSEFRRSANTASDGGVANGLSARWDVTEYLAMRLAAEHVEPIGADDDRTTSLSFGVAYENDEKGLIWRNDAEIERDERGLGLSANTAFGYEFNEDFTFLARNRFANDLRDQNRLRDRLRLGFAWRPAYDNRLRALGLYEFEIDDDQASTERAHRWSFGGTYAPTDDIRLNGRYSGEYFDIDSAGFAAESTLHLGRAGAEVDFGLDFLGDEFGRDRFALGAHVSAFTDNDGDNVTLGAGVELKANIVENVQLGVGYNYIDVEEERLRDLYQSGFFARLRIKLDDSIWDEFDKTGFTSGIGSPQ